MLVHDIPFTYIGRWLTLIVHSHYQDGSPGTVCPSWSRTTWIRRWWWTSLWPSPSLWVRSMRPSSWCTKGRPCAQLSWWSDGWLLVPPYITCLSGGLHIPWWSHSIFMDFFIPKLNRFFTVFSKIHCMLFSCIIFFVVDHTKQISRQMWMKWNAW